MDAHGLVVSAAQLATLVDITNVSSRFSLDREGSAHHEVGRRVNIALKSVSRERCVPRTPPSTVHQLTIDAITVGVALNGCTLDNLKFALPLNLNEAHDPVKNPK